VTLLPCKLCESQNLMAPVIIFAQKIKRGVTHFPNSLDFIPGRLPFINGFLINKTTYGILAHKKPHINFTVLSLHINFLMMI